jgi:uncharacterized membrane protein (DUF106 family)
MGIKTYKGEDGKTYAKGKPAGFWVLWTFGIIGIIIGIPITFANPIVGIIIFIITSLFFFVAKKYTEVKSWKKITQVLEAEEKEKELEEQNKAVDQQSEEQREFDEFKKWRNSRKDDVQK